MHRIVFVALIVIFFLGVHVLVAVGDESRSEDLKSLKVKFLTLLSDDEVDIKQARSILDQIPSDPKAFHDLDDLVDPMNPVIAQTAVIILHHLLNKFMLANSIEEKNQFLEIIQLGIERGMDVTATHKDDPPLYVKGLMIREMNITNSIITFGHKFITQEVIARSRKMSKFLTNLYSLPGEVVPPAKLLLHVEKIVETAGAKVQNRTDLAINMLRIARLDKPTIKASELLQFSQTYRNLVEHVSSNTAPHTKFISLRDIMASLDEYANLALTSLITAMESDPRAGIALEHFFDLHVLPDESNRNSFHYLCMARAHTMLRTLTASYSTNWDENNAFMRSMMAERIFTSLDYADDRGHSPLTYCAMRYGRRRHPDDIGSAFVDFLDVLKKDVTNEAFLNHIDDLKEILLEDAEESSLSKDADQPEGADGRERLGECGSIEECLKDEDPSSTESLLESPTETIPSGDVSDGGWNAERLQLDPQKYPYIKGPNRCDIMEIHGENLPDQADFFSQYINTATPVVFRGAALNETSRMRFLRHVFQKENFLKVYGGKKVSASSLPYGESFGVKSASKTLRQVANADRVINIAQQNGLPADATDSSTAPTLADDKIPLYTFVVPSNEWSQRIMRDVPLPEPLVVERPSDDKKKSSSVNIVPAYGHQLQFYLGAAGTGAPVHYHGPAINTLAYGEKKWVLFPPDYAFYSTVPALQYFLSGEFSQSHPLRSASTSARAVEEEGVSEESKPDSTDEHWMQGLQCTQYPGDIMFVPALWAHGTLNMKQSIGVAHEFSVETFCME